MSPLARDFLAPFRRRTAPAARAPLAVAEPAAIRPDVGGRRPASRLDKRLQRRRRSPVVSAAEGLERRLALAVDIAPITGNGFFFVDLGQGRTLDSEYAGYAITNNNPVTYADVWVQAHDFTGGFLDLSPNEDGVYHLGQLDPGETDRAWFYLTASGATVTPQSLVISVYEGDPRVGGTLIPGASESFDFTRVEETQETSSNKIESVAYDTATPVLGGTLAMIVTGDLGQAGGDSVLFTPDTFNTWQPGVFELETMTITITSGPNVRTVSDELFLTGFAQASSNPYTAVYTFRVVDVIATETPVSPTQFVGRDLQWKHDKPIGVEFPPVPAVTNPLLLQKLVKEVGSMDPPAPAIIVPADTNATVEFTLTFTNSSMLPASLDSIRDTLPPGTVYVPGSATYAGLPIGDPTIVGSELTWLGAFAVPPMGAATLAFDAVMPAVAGVYVNSSVGRVGSVQIDTTPNTKDDEPATATVTVAAIADLAVKKETTSAVIAGAEVTYLITVTNNGPTTLDTVELSDSSIPSLSDLDWSDESEGSYDPSTKLWTGLTLAEDESVTITLKGLLSGTATGSLANTAKVDSPLDEDKTNNEFTVTNEIGQLADLTVKKETKSAVIAGAEVTYLITVTNNGPTTLDTVELSDSSIPSLSDLDWSDESEGSYDPSTKLWTGLTLAEDESVTITLKGLLSGTATGSLANTAKVDSPLDEDKTNNEFTVTNEIGSLIELDVTKTGDELYKGGGLLNFTVVVTNLGPSFASDVRVTDALPAGVVSWSWTVSYDGTGSGTADGTPDSVTDSAAGIDKLMNLAVLGTATFTITALTSAAFQEDITNTATAEIGEESDSASWLSEYDGPINPTADEGALVVTNDDLCFGLPYVRVLDAETGIDRITPFLAYEPSFRGSVRVATGDLTGDGVDEIVVAPGPGRVGQIRVFTANGIELPAYRTLAFGPAYRGGVSVAVGNIDGIGGNEIIAARSSGLARVNVFGVDPLADDPVSDVPIRSFVGIPGAYRNGAVVTAGDYGTFTNGVMQTTVADGIDEIAVGSNAGIRAQVRVFDASLTPRQVGSFFAIRPGFRGGVTLSTARWNLDTADDIIVGAGIGGRSIVEVYGGTPLSQFARLAAFSSFGRPNAVVNAAALDITSDGIADNLYGVQGRGGSGGTRGVRRFERITNTTSTLPGSTSLRPPLRIAPITLRVAGG